MILSMRVSFLPLSEAIFEELFRFPLSQRTRIRDDAWVEQRLSCQLRDIPVRHSQRGKRAVDSGLSSESSQRLHQLVPESLVRHSLRPYSHRLRHCAETLRHRWKVVADHRLQQE